MRGDGRGRLGPICTRAGLWSGVAVGLAVSVECVEQRSGWRWLRAWLARTSRRHRAGSALGGPSADLFGGWSAVFGVRLALVSTHGGSPSAWFGWLVPYNARFGWPVVSGPQLVACGVRSDGSGDCHWVLVIDGLLCPWRR